MQNQNELSVTYSNVTIDQRNGEKTYWFEASFGSANVYSYCFGLDENGNCHTASGSFLDLDHETQEKFAEIGRQLLPNVLS